MTDRDTLRQKIADNRAAWAERKAQIEANKHLTPEGRRDALKTGFLASQTKHKELKAQYDEHVEGERQALRRQAFSASGRVDSLTSEVEAYRSAVARAAAAPDGKALDRMGRLAVTTNDRVTRRAVAAVAFDRGELAVVREYGDDNVKAVLEFEQQHGAHRDVSAKFADGMHLRGPERPAGIGNVGVN